LTLVHPPAPEPVGHWPPPAAIASWALPEESIVPEPPPALLRLNVPLLLTVTENGPTGTPISEAECPHSWSTAISLVV
jgi:hypothetical protein